MSAQGIECLVHSIEQWVRLFGDVFDRIVCFNGELPDELLGLNVEFIDQSKHLDSLPCTPCDTFWKFFPPRIRRESHELILDNDVVIYKSNLIERFLRSEELMVSQSHKHFYGRFHSVLEPGILVNTGFIGLPPGYDLQQKLSMVLKLYPFLYLTDHCDDQGAFICACRKQLKLVPMEELYVCNPRTDFAAYRLGTCGTHFAGLNLGSSQYWEQYKLQLSQ